MTNKQMTNRRLLSKLRGRPRVCHLSFVICILHLSALLPNDQIPEVVLAYLQPASTRLAGSRFSPENGRALVSPRQLESGPRAGTVNQSDGGTVGQVKYAKFNTVQSDIYR